MSLDVRHENTSVWMATEGCRSRPPLDGDVEADVCIIGAGIAGLSTAYLLCRENRSVVLVDDGPIGGGQTARTTAHLSNALDDRYQHLERLHGPHAARLAASSHTAAIDRIEQIAAEEAIECDFARLDGFLFAPPGESTDVLDRELEAARRAGLSEVEMVPRAPLDPFDTGKSLRFPRQGQFHPLKYLAGLAAALERRGGRIFGDTHATNVQGGEPARIETQHGPLIKAGAVVVATNTPINDLVAIHTKQAPYMTYVIGARVPRGSVYRALYWDTPDPYHYVRLQQDQDPAARGEAEPADLLIVGGEDHKTGHADDAGQRFARLEAWARQRFPMMQSVQYHWCGQVMEPVDGLAFIGRNPLDKDNVYIATGDSGMGMTHGTIAAILLTDLIVGRPNEWAGLYDPSRKTLRAAKEFLKENIDVAGMYGRWLTSGDVASVDEIPPGSGAVVRRGLTKVAVFRDDQGAIHELSASCPHLGCVVAWNSADKTWDCPCHGSRFDCHGRVVNGPANTDLEKRG